MRERKSADERRTLILEAAGRLFLRAGYAPCQMEHIRAEANLSRGGLYHHFSSKADVLAALVEQEIVELLPALARAGDPVVNLIREGAAHLGADAGIVRALERTDERELYLGLQDRAFARHVRDPLAEAIDREVAAGRYALQDAGDGADLFLAINARISRGVILEGWSASHAARFTSAALTAFGRLVGAEETYEPIIDEYRRIIA